MSIINKMLQELGKRNAGPVQAALPRPDTVRLAQQVRSVRPPGMGSGAFWRIVAGSVFLMLAWFAWVMWQSTSRPVVGDRVDQSAIQPRNAAPATAPAAAFAPETTRVNTLRLATEMASPAAVLAPETARVNTLRLATEMASPAAVSRDKDVRVPKVAGAPKAPIHAPQASQLRIQPAERMGARIDPDAGRIDKRVDTTPRQRAESELRRAMANVNAGRIAEGMEGLKASLLVDPAYETARQTLVALLLDAKRVGEAAQVLQEGLAVNPGNAAFAVLLARLTVERGDTQGALALLQRHLPSARQDAEYRAFLGALYQRLGRHAEAIAEYEISVQARPDHGAWWAGLGISQEALERTRDAGESFRRAKASGNLGADLAAYVDRRLRQLQ